MSVQAYTDFPALARCLRDEFENKTFILLYAYNGVGKTRLSTEFKNLGKGAEDEDKRDTLYFNAFTEDLFSWDNDLDNDAERVLKINAESRFFAGLDEMEMDNRIRPLLDRYADFDFRIDTDKWEVSFSREVPDGEGHRTEDGIKVSRGEENIFIWCFFLSIVQLVLDDDGSGPYGWVRYIYIDDPISSLDDQNAVAVATHLARLLKAPESQLKTVISTHHFNMLRAILEKTAGFHGYDNFSACIRQDDDDVDGVLHARLVNILSHGNYSLYEPREMLEENKEYFRRILHGFIQRYPFNPALFPSEAPAEANSTS